MIPDQQLKMHADEGDGGVVQQLTESMKKIHKIVRGKVGKLGGKLT